MLAATEIQATLAYNLVLNADLPFGGLEVTIDRAEMPPHTLFDLAARNNPKRAFLFLSRVLGKHLPVSPQVMGDVHERLMRHIPDLPLPVVFIGMAETATCLGQGIFEAWLRSHPEEDALYLHTTRYHVSKMEPVVFEETHSHAPAQWLYLPGDPVLRERFKNARSLVLIDDEISTGNTLKNLSIICHANAQKIQKIHFLSITDFSDKEHLDQLENQLGVELTSSSLLYGRWNFEFNNNDIYFCPPAQSLPGATPHIEDHGFGRLGRSSNISLPKEFVNEVSKSLHVDDRVLVLGTGEFMHSAYIFSRNLQDASKASVYMQATTRSPILPWGPIHKVFTFTDNYGENIPNYVYNCSCGQYDHVFICHETGPTSGLLALAQKLRARLFHFRSEFAIEENFIY